MFEFDIYRGFNKALAWDCGFFYFYKYTFKGEEIGIYSNYSDYAKVIVKTKNGARLNHTIKAVFDGKKQKLVYMLTVNGRKCEAEFIVEEFRIDLKVNNTMFQNALGEQTKEYES